METNTKESESPQIPAIPSGLIIRRQVPGALYHCRYILDGIRREETQLYHLATPESKAKYDADLELVKEIEEIAGDTDVNADTRLEVILDLILDSNTR